MKKVWILDTSNEPGDKIVFATEEIAKAWGEVFNSYPNEASCIDTVPSADTKAWSAVVLIDNNGTRTGKQIYSSSAEWAPQLIEHKSYTYPLYPILDQLTMAPGEPIHLMIHALTSNSEEPADRVLAIAKEWHEKRVAEAKPICAGELRIGDVFWDDDVKVETLHNFGPNVHVNRDARKGIRLGKSEIVWIYKENGKDSTRGGPCNSG